MSRTPVPQRLRKLAVVFRRRPHATAIGLLGSLLLSLGGLTYVALMYPPYLRNEPAHVGYTHSLREGRLPTITTDIPTRGDTPLMKVVTERDGYFPETEIHVANNPPFFYAAALPGSMATSWLPVRGETLLGFRLTVVAATVAAIGLSYLLGRELSNGDDFVGIATAGILAGVVSIDLTVARAALDGPSLAVTTGTTWALARFARQRTPRAALHLGVWCAAAAAVRPMALAYAAAAGLIGLVLAAIAHPPRALPGLALRLGAPTVLLTGWFYGLNIHRYGDPTGSNALFDKFNMQSNETLLEVLQSPRSLMGPLPFLIADVPGRDVWLFAGSRERNITWAAVATVVAAIALALWTTHARKHRGREERRPAPVPAAWISVALLLCVPPILLSQHASGGGGPLARYLLPMLPALAAAAALVTSRVHRGVTVAVVAVFVYAKLTRLRPAVLLAFGENSTKPPPLRDPLVSSSLVRNAPLGLAALGALVLLGALVYLTMRPTGDLDPPGDDAEEPASGDGPGAEDAEDVATAAGAT